MAFMVMATVGCENLHLTEVPVIGPSLVAGGFVQGSLSSSADFCDECGEPAVVMDYAAREVPVDYPNLTLYELR